MGFKIVVRLPFAGEDRHRPAPGRRRDGLVVPIGPLHQPNPDGGLPFLNPFAQSSQIATRVRQVSLDHNAYIGKVAKLGLAEDVLEDREGQVFERVVLHVEVHIRMMFLGHSQEGSQSRFHPF